jgi:hypothetical protein
LRRRIENKRGERKADRIIHEEGGEEARYQRHRPKQHKRMSGARHDPVVDEAEKSGEPQIRDDDHHAEQQRDRIDIDRPVGVVERQ